MKTSRARAFWLILLLAFAAGCRSAHIDITVENRTGSPIELVEVDYPSASFGTDTIAPGANYRYRIQVRLSGPVKVTYTESATHKVRQMTGPELSEGQTGRLDIVLLPDGKAEFQPQLVPRQ
ncbi:MAG TPA: hypothetical protein VMU48_17400 [Terracidiphilus sp.]|nr:hypothetical protein [Terracidiphilus sp.]